MGPAFAPLVEHLDAAISSFAVGAADEQLLASDPRVAGAAREMITEALRQGADGMACDIIAADVVPWGFDPAAVGAPVHLFYGDADDLVPLPHAAWWADHLAQASVHEVAGAGHLVPFVAWPAVLSTT